MAVSNADILGWLNENPNASPALINQTMAEAGVSADQYQSATGAPPPPVPQATTQEQVAPPPPVQQTVATPTVTNADILGWLNANPGADAALINQTMADAGVSAAQYQAATGSPPPSPAPASIVDLYQQVLGRAPESKTVIKEWEKQFGNTIEPEEVEKFKQAAQLEKTNPTAANLKGQILAQNLTSKWSGEGHGSAEKNASDMAKILADIGIKNIKDFGKVTQYAPVQEIGKTYNGQQVITTTNDEGQTISYVREPTGEYQYDYETGENRPVLKTVFVPPDAKLGSVYGQYDGYETVTPVDQSKITFKDGKPVVAAGETFGNKKTGQAVPNTYSERQTGDFFGGTFAGKGNTGYGVKFAPDGTPIFYTAGASSNDLVNMFADDPLLGTIAQIGAAYFGGPAGSAALSAAMGKKPGDILKSAALSYLGNQAGSFVSGTEGITNALGEVGTNIASNAAKQFVASGGENIDPVKLLLGSGAINSFLGGGSGVDGPNSADFEEGYFSPGGEGFNVLNSNSTDDFLRSIGINSVDELTDSGLSNADILSLVNADYIDFSAFDGLNIAGDTLPSVDEDFPSTYKDGSENGIDSLINSGTLGNISNVARSLIGGGGPTAGGTKATTSGTTGSTTTTGGTTGGTTAGGTKTTGGVKATGGTKTTSGTKTTGGTNVAKAVAGLMAGAKGAKAATPTLAKSVTPTNPAVDAITNLAQQQQQSQQGALLNLMGGKDELANIKSYKELYGDGLFADGYVPPSAGGSEEQGAEEEFFNGGHVNDLSINALLHMLRN
jgi:hypothetical protein